jgi:hypothetical protein
MVSIFQTGMSQKLLWVWVAFLFHRRGKICSVGFGSFLSKS